MKKIICLVLALLMIALTISCTKGENQNNQSTESTEKTEGVPVKDFGGATFKVICRARDGAWGELAIAAEDTDGTTLNDATYNRNTKVEELYKIKLDVNEISEAVTQKGMFYNKLYESITTGDYIADLAIPGILDACTLIPTNLFYDLQTVSNIDLDAEWWQQKINESVRLVNKQYFAFNSMTLNDKCDTYLYYFNKDNFDDYGIEYPYKYVTDGTWTNEKFAEIIRGYGADLNGDNRVDYEDKIGFTYLLLDTFFIGGGITGAKLDKDGYPYIVDFSTKISDIFDDISDLASENNWNTINFGNLDQLQTVLDGNGLFASFHMLQMMEIAASYQSHIGLVPCPKYDENQKEFYSRAGYNGATVISVPTTVPNLEMSGLITEAFAYWSEKYISPAFYEKLFTNRYTDDEESKAMLDIVIKSEVVDLDQVFQWGNMLVSISAAATKGQKVSSAWARMSDMASKACTNTINDYFKMD